MYGSDSEMEIDDMVNAREHYDEEYGY